MALSGYRFVQGFTGDVRNSIEKREEAERERKKSVFLEELRRDTYKWQAEYDAARAKSQSDKNMTQYDYDRGVKILKNSDGDTLREIPLTKYEIETADTERRSGRAKLALDETKAAYAGREAEMGLARDRAAIEASRASAESSRASAQATRRGLSSVGGDDDVFGNSGAAKVERRVQELLYRNQDIAAGLKAAGVPEENIQQLAAEAIIRAPNEDPARALEIFRSAAGNLRARAKNARYNTRPAGLEGAASGTMFTPKP